MSIQILIDEITNDPLVRGYAGMTDQQVVDSINTANRTITRQFVSGSEIFNATDDIEYGLLTDAQKSAWDALCAIDSIDTGSGVARAREAELFGAGTSTRTNLQAIRQSTVSRAQELGITVNFGDVVHARAA